MAALIWVAAALMCALALVLAWRWWRKQDADAERIRRASERVNEARRRW